LCTNNESKRELLRRVVRRPETVKYVSSRETASNLWGRALMKAVGRKFFDRQEKKSGERVSLHPDNTFLIEKIVDHFDALTHLGLSLIGHRQHRSDEFPRLHVFQ
jgi:hypothetical protein